MRATGAAVLAACAQGPVVHVPACTPSAGNRSWLAFADGCWAEALACIPLLVRTGFRLQTVHIGVGATCPAGHRPQFGDGGSASPPDA